MNEGAPDVAVVNYNVFNRDGVYTTNILQKTGNFELAARCIDYFLAHPFNGRVQPEADNPGQVLWVIGEHWKFTRDKAWLDRVYPKAAKLAAMIEYCRTTPEPHWVSPTSLDFGEALPVEQRKKLLSGACDGYHPEYTEAFDVAGLRAAAALAEAAGNKDDAAAWGKLADKLFRRYDETFSGDLGKGYGSYCVLWPCRLYPLGEGKAFDHFQKTGEQKPAGWRYFPLATAHQGLLAGNREAGAKTIEAHLNHEQMTGGEPWPDKPVEGWYAFDEGGKSGPGNWAKLRTTWDPGVAMPHGWAVAEMHLLLRDSLAYEDGDKLVLLAGVPWGWMFGNHTVAVTDLPTYFGPLSFAYAPAAKKSDGVVLTFTGQAAPPGGFVLKMPKFASVIITADGKPLRRKKEGDIFLPAGTRRVTLQPTLDETYQERK